MFFEWKNKNHLSAVEIAAMLGVSQQTLCNAGRRESVPPPWEAFVRVVSSLPNIKIVDDATDRNQPVAYFNGGQQKYGPADIIQGDGRIAAHVVIIWSCDPDRSDAEYQLAKRFLRYWPDGPQLK